MKNKNKLTIIAVLLAVLGLALIVIGANPKLQATLLNTFFSDGQGSSTGEGGERFGSLDRNGDGMIHILLTGVDNEYAAGMDQLGNADGTLIISVNPAKKRIILTSVLRDTVIPRAANPWETNKVTLMYHYYGYEEYRDSLESALGITFDYYVRFNYLNIIDIVDALGGIDMELYDEEIIEANAKLSGLNLQLLGLERFDGIIEEGGGMHHLTGKQVAGFLRVRLSDGTNNDFGRTERNRRVMVALKERLLSLGIPKQLAFIRQVINSVEETNLSPSSAAWYAVNLLRFKNYAIVQCSIPQPDTYYGADGYLYADLDANLAYLYEEMGITK